MQTKPEDVMPWKVNGERWHLGEKGFPPGKKVQWDRALLPRLLELVREIEPARGDHWDNAARDHAARAGREPGVGAVADQGQPTGWIAASWARRGSST